MGVAVATLIAQAVSAVLVTLKLMRSEGILKLSVKQIRFHGSILKMQLKLGLPTGFEAILFSITYCHSICCQHFRHGHNRRMVSLRKTGRNFLDGQHCVRNCDHNIRRAKLRRRKNGSRTQKYPRMPSYGFYCFRRTCCLSDRRTIPFIPVIYKRQSCN